MSDTCKNCGRPAGQGRDECFQATGVNDGHLKMNALECECAARRAAETRLREVIAAGNALHGIASCARESLFSKQLAALDAWLTVTEQGGKS